MKESVAVAKQADAKKGVSPTRSDNSIHRVRDEPERQLGSLRDVIGNIRHDGGTPSVESIAMQLSGMHTAQRAPALLALQQTHGNRYVQRVVSGIQAKLVVGQPGDNYEQEADRVADRVMRMPEPEVQREVEEEEEELLQPKLEASPRYFIQRQEEEEEEPLMMKPLLQRQADDSFQASHSLERCLAGRQGGGRPLPDEVRSFMESRFNADFSPVRVHTDSEAVQMNRELNAQAFTNGNDVYFGAGRYDPHNTAGKRLLAHELTHVVQQNNGSVPAQVIQLDPLDDIRDELHRMPPPTTREATREERQAIWERRERLRRAFRSIDPLEAGSIYNRLVTRREGDEISMLFHDMLARPTREEMLTILRRRFPTRIEMEEEEITVPTPEPEPTTTPPPTLTTTPTPRPEAGDGGCFISICGSNLQIMEQLFGLQENNLTNFLNCFCLGAGLLDLVGTNPWVEGVDCACNIVTTVQTAVQRGIEGDCWAPCNYSLRDGEDVVALSALTVADCASLSLGSALASAIGGLIGVGGGTAAEPGGGTLVGGAGGVALGAIIGDFILDLAAMALQNMITQRTPWPVSQCRSCVDLARAVGVDVDPQEVCSTPGD
jgi:hypothetical protein